MHYADAEAVLESGIPVVPVAAGSQEIFGGCLFLHFCRIAHCFLCASANSGVISCLQRLVMYLNASCPGST
jgi:hypothetical protein